MYAYGGMGVVGYDYISAKDNLKWEGVSVRQWIHIVMQVGIYMSLSKEDWDKAKRGRTTGDADIASALKAAFGDGINNK